MRRKRAAELFGAGVGLRRLSDREKTLLIDRLRPACSPGSMTCLPGIAPGGHHCCHARLSVDGYAGLGTEAAEAFAASKGRYGYRGIMAMLGAGVSEKAVRGCVLSNFCGPFRRFF